MFISLILPGILVTLADPVKLTLLTGWAPVFIRKRKGRISDSWVAFSNAAGVLKKKPGALFINFILSLFFQITVAMVVASVIWGLGLPFPGFTDMVYITCASSVFAMIPAGIN